MSAPVHIALYISSEENVNILTDYIMSGKQFPFAAGLEKKKGSLFSLIAIRELVKEELLHDHYEVMPRNGHSLYSSSSGEQRRALLDHILDKSPDYIIVDNVFDSLDEAGKQVINTALNKIACHTLIIQILSRKKDCLAFIDTVYTIENANLIQQQSRYWFLQPTQEAANFYGTIPLPFKNFELEQEVLVKMDHVSVKFNDRQVLKDICWEIKPGEFWQLTGPNGSGKTTLLSMIFGDNTKGYGQGLYLFGRKKGSGEAVWDIKEKIGYFSSAITAEFPRQDTVEKMILSGFVDSIGLYTTPSDIQIELTREWLSLIGLLKIKDTPYRSLTLAQQRMVLVVRAMVKYPPLLILDEPTSGLDDHNSLLLTSLINKIAEETRTAIIYVSHREEAGLQPQKIFELVSSEGGSAGRVK